MKLGPKGADAATTLKRALGYLEESLAHTNDPDWHMSRLRGVAKLAFKADDHTKAERYARELLSLAEPRQKDEKYGPAWHDGHVVLGRVELKRDTLAAASDHLLQAGRGPAAAVPCRPSAPTWAWRKASWSAANDRWSSNSCAYARISGACRAPRSITGSRRSRVAVRRTSAAIWSTEMCSSPPGGLTRRLDFARKKKRTWRAGLQVLCMLVGANGVEPLTSSL